MSLLLGFLSRDRNWVSACDHFLVVGQLAWPAIVRILIPIIIRLWPAVPEIPVIARLLVIFQLHPSTDAELERALAYNYKRKPKQHGPDKDTGVVKLDDAIKCVEQKIGDGNISRKGIIALAKLLFNPVEKTSPIGDSIIECLRESALRQDTPRVYSRSVRGFRRPAKGHGHGRI